jgi:two-component system sensor histidine kinase/response regulator
MNDHISKPIDPGNLYETVGRFYKPASPAVPPFTTESKQSEGRAQQADDLPSIAGLDTKDGLTRVAGNGKLYLKLLRQFVEQQGPAVGQITEALAKGDVALAERLAHTLKGVAGNIGAKSVHSTAATLEKTIRARGAASEINAAQQQLAAALDPLTAGLKTSLNSDLPLTAAPTPAAPVNPAESRASAKQLAKLLAEFDPGAADFIEANRAALQPLFNDGTWAEFEKLVQGYSFADAQAQLEKVVKEFSTA